MKKNQKGFTLVELLAVIVILAVLILIAVTAVLPQMEKSRKNAFADEVLAFGKAAREAYTTSAMTDAQECWDLSDLKGEYITKNDDNYTGFVVVDATTGDGTAYITNGKYVANGKPTTASFEPTEGKASDLTYATCEAYEAAQTPAQG